MQKLTKLTTFLFFISFSLSAFSQADPFEAPDIFNEKETKAKLNIHASFEENSTAFSNSMALQMARRGNLSNEIIDKSAKNLWKQNYFGMDADFGVSYSMGPKYFFTIGYHSQVEAAFSADAFNLVLRGNSMFAGKDANLKTTAMKQLSYEKAEFGMKLAKGRAYAALALLNGRDYLDIDFGDSKLFTEKDGQYIDATVHFESEKNMSRGFNPGLALKAGYRVMKTEKMKVDVSVKDFGFISWGGDQLKRSMETEKRFSGWVVPPVQKWSDTSYINESIDSLRQNFELETDTTHEHMTILPFQVRVDISLELKGHAELMFGVAYTHSYSLPMVYIGYRRPISTTSFVEGALVLGGYGKLNLNAAYGYSKGTLSLKFGIMGLEGLAVPKQACGIGGFITISKDFE